MLTIIIIIITSTIVRCFVSRNTELQSVPLTPMCSGTQIRFFVSLPYLKLTLINANAVV